MNEEKKVKYGEIYFYDFGEHEGSIQNGLRPAVVIQDNKLICNGHCQGETSQNHICFN